MGRAYLFFRYGYRHSYRVADAREMFRYVDASICCSPFALNLLMACRCRWAHRWASAISRRICQAGRGILVMNAMRRMMQASNLCARWSARPCLRFSRFITPLPGDRCHISLTPRAAMPLHSHSKVICSLACRFRVCDTGKSPTEQQRVMT